MTGSCLPFLRRPRFLGKLFGRFVQTDQRAIRIARRCVSRQHVPHGGYEGAVCLWWNDPLCFEMRLERAFFESADSDEVAQAFRDNVARGSEMMPPGSGALLADDLWHSIAGRSISLACSG